jgi:hypothetical protein
MSIPIIIICFNNWKYVKNTIDQIIKTNKEYEKNIHIMDNNSTCADTIAFLETLPYTIFRNTTNNGPRIASNMHIYNKLPDKFILTDPDLQFYRDIPHDFVEQMSNLSDIYCTSKIGFALDISDSDKMYKGPYFYGRSIPEWESRWWNHRIHNDTYELYEADLDTTFALYNKKYPSGKQIRIAGTFTAKHLPWYIEDPVMTMYDKVQSLKDSKWSTSGNIIMSYIAKHSDLIKEEDLKNYNSRK